MESSGCPQISIKNLANLQNGQSQENQNVNQEKVEIFEGEEFEKIQQSNVGLQTTNSLNQKSADIFEQSQEKPQNPQSKQTKSVFHNFQKHLVITLRQSIKIRKSTQKKEPQTVAWQIWQNFTNQTKVYTKNILHIVFGVVDYEGSDLTNIYDEDIIQKFGYSEIFSRYSDSLLTEAQQFLRSEVIRQLKRINLKDMMKKRRLADMEQFIEYVKEFVGQLEEGPMRKRLPKTKKVQMKLGSKSKMY